MILPFTVSLSNHEQFHDRFDIFPLILSVLKGERKNTERKAIKSNESNN